MMRKRYIVLFFFVFSSIFLMEAQTGDRDMDLRFGLGISKPNKSNGILLLSEYEFNVILSDYFAIAPSIALNHETYMQSGDAYYFQANLNAFVSPFRNNRQHDVRIGSGLGFYKSDEGLNRAIRSAFGVNLIIENRYMVSDHFFIGLKAFLQPFFDKETNYGVLLKGGINL